MAAFGLFHPGIVGAKDAGKRGINENDSLLAWRGVFVFAKSFCMGPASEILIPQRESRILGIAVFATGGIADIVAILHDNAVVNGDGGKKPFKA